MRVVILGVFIPSRRVETHVRHHAGADKILFHVPANQIQTLPARQLRRQGDIDFSAHLRISPFFTVLDSIPERGPVKHPIRRAIRCQDFRVQYTVLAGVVVHLACALLDDYLTGTVSRSARGAPALRTTNLLHAEVVNCHGAILRAAGRTRHAVTYKCALHDFGATLLGSGNQGNAVTRIYHKIASMTTATTPPEPAAPASPPAPKKTRLEIARQKADQANALLEKLEARARSKELGQQRKLDTRRKVLLGSYLLGRIQKDDEMKAQVLAGLDQFLTRDAERALFDLLPVVKPDKGEGDALQEQAPVAAAEPVPTAPPAESGV